MATYSTSGACRLPVSLLPGQNTMESVVCPLVKLLNSAAGKTRHTTHHGFTLCCLHCWKHSSVFLTCGTCPCHRGQMSAEEVSVVIWQLLQALKFLHRNNVWHRYQGTYLTIHTLVYTAS